jgi:myo-inositol 2-dehydrogenase/D-chiro-inositol 1-dehydrogenase
MGHGPDEDAWRRVLAGREGVELLADVGPDVDDALLVGEPEAVVVGGPIEGRGELVRRAAELGLAVLALHPPGPDPDALYQVAVLPADQAPPFVPGLPLARHPALLELAARVDSGALGDPASIRYEADLGPDDAGPLDARAGAVAAALAPLLGEIEAVTAAGGDGAAARRVVHLRGPTGRDAEVRLARGLAAAERPRARLELLAAGGSALWEHDPDLAGPSTLTLRRAGAAPEVVHAPAWDPRAALLEALEAQAAGAPARPDLRDALLAAEVADAVERGLRKGRTVELHRDEISQLGSFKAVMTSLGCGVILLALTLYVLALILRALDVPGAGLLAWSIVPLLGGYVALQLLRLAARPSRGRGR